MEIIQIIVGLLLLTLGRRLFWLFVSAIGFVAGFFLAARFFEGQPDWIIVVIALLGGLLGAGLAVLLQSIAIAVAGFFAGGYLASNLAFALGLVGTQYSWIPFVIGGIIGLVLLAVLFDWGLIILSSFTGANFIVETIELPPPTGAILLIVLVAVGIAVQATLLTRRAEPPPPTA